MDASELAVARYAAHISLWALYVSAAALFVSACVFALELRRWFDEGVRLTMSVMVGAKIIGGLEVDKNKYLSVVVTNRGSAPTTVTHMVLFNYPNYLAGRVPIWLSARIKRFRPETFLINSIGAPGPIPYLLEPGRMWNGRAIQTSDVKGWSRVEDCTSASSAPTVTRRCSNMCSERGNRPQMPKRPNA